MTEEKRNMLSADSRFLVSFLLEESLQASGPVPEKPAYAPTPEVLAGHEQRFQSLSLAAARGYLPAAEKVLPFVCAEEFDQWTDFGIHLLHISQNDPAMVLAFFSSSPSVFAKTSFTYLKGWVEKAMDVAKLSIVTATTYLALTPSFISLSNNILLHKWGDWCIQLLDREGVQSSLGISFLKHSIACLQFMTFREFREYKNLGFMLLRCASSPGIDFFSRVPSCLGELDITQRRTLYDFARFLSRHSPEEGFDFFRKAPRALAKISPFERNRVLAILEKLTRTDRGRISIFFHSLMAGLKGLPHPRRLLILDAWEKVSDFSIPAGQAFIKNTRKLLFKIPDCFLPLYVETGVMVGKTNALEAERYFSLTAASSRREIAKWRSAARLEDHSKTLSVLALAMTGNPMPILRQGDDEKNALSHMASEVSTDGQAIYLPWFMAGPGKTGTNFNRYKIATAHQAGMVEFSTFSSDLPVMVNMLADLSQGRLALDIFFILEHGRIDFQLARHYPGLKKIMVPMVSMELTQRPHPESLPLQAAWVELLTRYSVKPFTRAYNRMIKNLPPHLSPHLGFFNQALYRFYEKNNSVWHCFEKTYEIYHHIKTFANIGPGMGEEPYHRCPPLTFRGRIHPWVLSGRIAPEKETTGDPSPGASGAGEKDPGPMDGNDRPFEGMSLVRGELQAGSGDSANTRDLLFLSKDDFPDHKCKGPAMKFSLEDSPYARASDLAPDGYFYYDEWDYLQKAYRKKWCKLREVAPGEGPMEKIDAIYEENRGLIRRVKRQFQQIKPSVHEKISKSDWGDEIDLVAVVEGVVDKRAGNMISDKVFIRKERKIQSLAVLFLVDMSASTGNPVAVKAKGEPSEGCNVGEDSAAGLKGSKMAAGKKLIDIEMESLVVVMEALESLGHDFAAWGFSGYGRQDVNIYPIKEFSDTYGDPVKKRISGMETQRSTRMGAAIRHGLTKLSGQAADQRLMIVLSDGFPQDYDYGEDRASHEYGIHDTMMALMEAKRRDILPFCITIDHEGKDYLRKMCEPGAYLVIRDIASLPDVLPKIVASLIR